MATVSNEEPELAGSPDEPAPERRSMIAMLRNVVLDLTQVVEDSTDLVGASIREELAQFREDVARHTLSVVAIIIGASLVSAGLAMFASPHLGWPSTLLIFGAIYLAFAFWVQAGKSKRTEERWK